MSHIVNTFKPTMRSHRSHSGFTLIEVLVTVVVVSIGLLGLAGLQINGLRANMSSETRSKATLLANDIVERMRTNPLGVAAGAYDGISIAEGGCADPATICSSTSTSSGPVPSCTPIQMAAFDAWVWGCGMTPAAGTQRGGVTNQLPAGVARVTCTASPCPPGTPHTVTVSWNERSPTDGTPVAQNITLVVVP